MIDFPASPTLGQQFTAAGVTWTWDGVKWLPSGLSPTVVPGINDNRIINGDMRIDQRNNGATVIPTATSYTLDRWQCLLGQPSKLAFSKTKRPNPWGSLTIYLVNLNRHTRASADLFAIIQTIEADMIADFAWGTANAQSVTLSFWAFSTKTGTFSGSVANNGQGSGRSYPFTYSIPVVSVWTKIIVTIPGDTSGPWSLQGNGAGLGVHFDLGTGTTYRGPANAWGSAYYVGATGAQSIVATNGASFS